MRRRRLEAFSLEFTPTVEDTNGRACKEKPENKTVQIRERDGVGRAGIISGLMGMAGLVVSWMYDEGRMSAE